MTDSKSNPMAGLVGLIEGKYPLKIISSEYVLVDPRWNIYHVVYKVDMNENMRLIFEEQYGEVGQAKGVQWEKSSQYNTYVFHSDIGNNILLLWDEILEHIKKSK